MEGAAVSANPDDASTERASSASERSAQQVAGAETVGAFVPFPIQTADSVSTTATVQSPAEDSNAKSTNNPQ
jgi:hypothetical protein